MDLERLISALAPTDVVRRAPTVVSDLAYDTRAVEPGALFFCVPGARADGHELAGEAVDRGAAALVVERPLELSVPQLVVADARGSMAVAADEFFSHPSQDLDVVGVTGTNGKTTTAFLLDAILTAAGRRAGLLTNVERRVGGEPREATLNTPEAIDLQRLLREMLDAGDDACVLEATSHGSVQRRLDRVRFRVLVFTNLTRDHLDFHGSMEAYFAAKRRLFDQADAAVVNVGDAYGRRLADDLGDRALTFALGGTGELGEAVLRGLDVRLPGRFNRENVLGALAASRLLGIDDAAVVEGVAALAAVPGRMEPIDEGQPFTVLVDYAHTPDALERVLAAARELAHGGRVVCLFGCGGDRDRDKRPLMGRIASEAANLVIVTSDNPRGEDPDAIVAAILAGVAGGADVEVELDRGAAIRRAVDAANAGDVVVIAGKGHEQGQEARGRVLPFDDRTVARDALARAAAAS
jgi:UDP-N-acetylmuramoyl-L-alanyl-D-glutamate--2,6-diaminopimelate ligase